ncbi:MAG: YggU family protein [Planctomycetes bacterium]|nr:YggU family protein [Planctomycetota bacterium]
MTAPLPTITENGDGVVFPVKIVPGSSRTAVAGMLENMIKIRVAAPPEKGKANQCLIAFLAQQLGVKKNAVEILSGHTHPVKQVRVAGITAADLLAKLGLNQPNRP